MLGTTLFGYHFIRESPPAKVGSLFLLYGLFLPESSPYRPRVSDIFLCKGTACGRTSRNVALIDPGVTTTFRKSKIWVFHYTLQCLFPCLSVLFSLLFIARKICPDNEAENGFKKREKEKSSIKIKIMNNIQESREYQLAKEWEMAVNSYTFNPKKFAAAIPSMHPTLQQSLYRLIKECIKVMADESRRYDDRNRASHEEAVRIMEYLNEHGKNIPLR